LPGKVHLPGGAIQGGRPQRSGWGGCGAQAVAKKEHQADNEADATCADEQLARNKQETHVPSYQEPESEEPESQLPLSELLESQLPLSEELESQLPLSELLESQLLLSEELLLSELLVDQPLESELLDELVSVHQLLELSLVVLVSWLPPP
jgi:hypothetical protein